MYIKFWSIVANNIYFFGSMFWLVVCMALLSPIAILFFRANQKSSSLIKWSIITKTLMCILFLLIGFLPLYAGVVAVTTSLSAPWGEKMTLWPVFFRYLLFCLPAILAAMIHFWPIWWRGNLHRCKQILGWCLCQELTTLVICFALTYQVFLLNGYTFLKNVNLIWFPQRQLTQILSEMSVHESLPENRKELLRDNPVLQEIKNYGRWCYFYQPDDNDFYLVAEYSRLWFIYNRSGEIERTYQPNKSSWRWLIDKCRCKQWW